MSTLWCLDVSPDQQTRRKTLLLTVWSVRRGQKCVENKAKWHHVKSVWMLLLTVRCLLQLTKLNISTIKKLTYSRQQRDTYFHEMLPPTCRGGPYKFWLFCTRWLQGYCVYVLWCVWLWGCCVVRLNWWLFLLFWCRDQIITSQFRKGPAQHTITNRGVQI